MTRALQQRNVGIQKRTTTSPRNQSMVLALSLSAFFILVAQSTLYNEVLMNNSISQSSFLSLFSAANHRVSSTSLGSQLVAEAYQTTYGASEMEKCPMDQPLEHCFADILKAKVNSTLLPWWLHTMMRDTILPSTGLRGDWRFLTSIDPPLRVCAIEKVASKQWRDIIGRLRNATKVEEIVSPKEVPPLEGTPKIVFLRDPLERFLSAYLDKCHPIHIRMDQRKHCKPYEIFNFSEKTELTDSIYHHPKRLFEAYIDALPLKWDVHFLPMSLQCDGLYRRLPEYEFVGTMGPSFHEDLGRLEHMYGEKLEAALKKTYKVDPTTGKIHHGKAPTHVLQYYTAESVRRVLRYLSIDYVKLRLTVPDWAEEMLQEDTRKRNELFPSPLQVSF